MYTTKQNEYYKERRRAYPFPHRSYNRKSYLKHKASRNARTRAYQSQAKVEVIAHYSDGKNECACCHTVGLPFLTIDHISGDGAIQRRKGIHTTGKMFYIWLRSHKYPKGFQVLCHNCNQAKRQLPRCPHADLLTSLTH